MEVVQSTEGCSRRDIVLMREIPSSMEAIGRLLDRPESKLTTEVARGNM